ncbi:MAG: metallophosphoesterase [Ferruginibacter sp.]
MSRTFAIGDIHGALKALQQLLHRISPEVNDHFIFLGDYVDGWPQSAEVIQFLMDFSNRYKCVFVKGNHDTDCEEWLINGMPKKDWLFHGGQMTMDGYGKFSEEQRKQHLEFFNRMHDYYVDEDNRLFIHAGFSSMYGPVHEHYGNNYKWDRTLWEMALTMDKRVKKHPKLYPKRLLLFKEIYIGHTPTLNYDVEVPMNGCNVWNVDTGAAFYGKLSAINIDSKEIFQSDTVMSLYPGEKGRNH